MRAKVLAALVVGAILEVGLGHGSAAAATKEPMAVRGIGTVERDHPPIPGSGAVLLASPPNCSDSGAARGVCDVIPIQILDRPSSPESDFWIEIRVSWVDSTGAGNLDANVWDDGQTMVAGGGSGYTRIDRAATANNPEVVHIYEPRFDRYNLTVHNYAGPNVGYRVTIIARLVPFERPAEALAVVGWPGPTSAGPAVEPPVMASGGKPPPVGAPAAAQGKPDVSPADPDPDLATDLVGFELALGSRGNQGPAAARLGGLGPPRPVPGWVAAFWLGVVPGLLVGAAVVVVRRRPRWGLAA